MVEKKTEKKTTRKPERKYSSKKSSPAHTKKAEHKTVVKTVPVKVEKNSCQSNDTKCCSVVNDMLSLIIGILVFVNIILAALVLCDKVSYNDEMIAKIGGSNSYTAFEEIANMDNFKAYTTKMINQTVENITK